MKVFIVEVLISIVIGFTTSYFVSGTAAFLAGIFVFFSLELMNLRLLAEEINRQYGTISGFLASLTAQDGFAELRLVYGLRNMPRFQEHSVEVEADYVLNFWSDCVAKTKSNWRAVSFVRADQTWDLGWGKDAPLRIQQERIKAGCSFERVFVVSDEAELERLKRTMKDQHSIGIVVGWVFERELKKNQLTKNLKKELGSLDFSVIDNQWVYITHLSRTRSIQAASATIDNRVRNRALAAGAEIIKMARRQF